MIAAQRLYTGLMAMDEEDMLKYLPGGEEAYEEFETMISETEWDKDVKTLTKDTRQKMYAFFGHEWNPPAAKQ